MWIFGCGSPSKSTVKVEESSSTSASTTIDSEPIVATNSVIETVTENSSIELTIIGNYNGDSIPFYAKVSTVDSINQITYISFEKQSCPQIAIPKTMGGAVSSISLEGFDRDLLLVTTKLKDPNFNKYFIFVLRNNEWKPVVNGFAIHKSHLNQISQPLEINPDRPKEILRYYSVFDLDETNPLVYTWRLLRESVAILNW